jgi:hypothetical protein
MILTFEFFPLKTGNSPVVLEESNSGDAEVCVRFAARYFKMAN